MFDNPKRTSEIPFLFDIIFFVLTYFYSLPSPAFLKNIFQRYVNIQISITLTLHTPHISILPQTSTHPTLHAPHSHTSLNTLSHHLYIRFLNQREVHAHFWLKLQFYRLTVLLRNPHTLHKTITTHLYPS